MLGALLVLCTGAGWAELNEEGKAAYSRGDLIEAERLFREAVAAAPGEAMPHYHHGVALSRLQRWDEAAAAYRRALRLDPSDGVAAAARQALHGLQPMLRPRASASRDVGLPPPVRVNPRPARPEPPADSIRLRRVWGNWFVDVVVNGLRHATFLVDTGATACALTPALAEAVGIRPDADRPRVLVRGVAGTTYGHVVTIPTLRVGDVEAHDVRAIIMPLDGMDGILGNTFLARYATTVDPTHGLLTLRPR